MAADKHNTATPTANDQNPLPSTNEQGGEAPSHFGPHHSPFSWLHATAFDPRAELLTTTYDVCRGVETCLDILMNAQLRSQSHGDDDTDPENRALLSISDTERLLRLAHAATRMLANDADVAITEINRLNRQGGK